MILGHGNNPFEFNKIITADFSSNVAFNHKSESLKNYLSERISCIHSYPDPETRELSERIAKHHNTEPNRILVTNGSAEAMYLIAHLTELSNTAIIIPSFSEYEDACTLYKHTINYISSQEFAELRNSPFGSVWLGNPNNPDGNVFSQNDILEKCYSNPLTVFILDEAYTHLCLEKTECFCGNSTPKNLIIIKSLTKAFAIPGLRLGYILANPDVIQRLYLMRPPWSVNTMSLIAGTYIMDHYSSLLPSANELNEESLFLQKKLSAIKGIEIKPSTCNFFLGQLVNSNANEVEIPGLTAKILKQILVDEYSILIRDASNFKGLTKYHFRIAAQNHNENIKLIEAINNIINKSRI